jgi:hypothetical protein
MKRAVRRQRDLDLQVADRRARNIAIAAREIYVEGVTLAMHLAGCDFLTLGTSKNEAL